MYAPEQIFGDLALFGDDTFSLPTIKYRIAALNAFHLVRTDTAGALRNASTTIEPQGCNERKRR
jgi:hypothetical protein